MNDRANEHVHNTISQLVLASSSPRRKELVALLDLSLPVSIFSVEIDEHIDPAWQPAEAVEHVSLNKAVAVADAIAQEKAPRHINSEAALILTADTVVVVDGQIVGKPASAEEARHSLRRLQGRSHYVYTGLVLMHSGNIKPALASTIVDEKVEESVQSGSVVVNALQGNAAQNDEVAFGQFGHYQLFHNSEGELTIVKGYSYSKVTFRAMSEAEIHAYVKSGEPLDKAGSYGVQGIGSVFIEKIEGDFYSVMGLPLNLLYQMLLKFGLSPFTD